MLCILLDKTRNSLHVLSRSTSQRAPRTFASLKMTQEGMLSVASPHGLSGITGRPEVAPYGCVRIHIVCGKPLIL